MQTRTPVSGVRIFISYRREDSAEVTYPLADSLIARLGKDSVFLDIDTIGPGEDFVRVIEETIRACDGVIVVIGHRWVKSRELRRRLAKPDDLHRLEIEAALRRQIPVIPVLVNGADMPSGKDMPESLLPLRRRNALELRSKNWARDIEKLVAAIERMKAASSVEAPASGSAVQVGPRAQPAPRHIEPAEGSSDELPELIGRYRLEAVLSRGVLGVTYRARQIELDRLVMLQLVGRIDALDPSFVERFGREGMVAAAVEHPNILPIYEADEAQGFLYVVMRYVEGARNLRAIVRDEGALEPDRASRIVLQTSGALEAAHALGVVHRDVRPRNILVAPPGDHVYLMGLGFGRLGHELGTGSRAELADAFDFAAPEVIGLGSADARSDVYALAATAYDALTGRVPFDRSAQEERPQAMPRGELRSVRDVAPALSPEVDVVIRRALAEDPGDRYASVGEFARALAGAIDLQ